MHLHMKPNQKYTLDACTKYRLKTKLELQEKNQNRCSVRLVQVVDIYFIVCKNV